MKFENFRNFKDLNLDFSKRCNVFYGSNGCGKTNLLEAISIFSKGRGLRKDKIFNLNISSSHNSFVYLVTGEIKIGNNKHEQLQDSTLIYLQNGNDLKISATKKSKFLIIAGKPIGEPIARGGPFVMNTKKEILKAVQDYHSGNFVQK